MKKFFTLLFLIAVVFINYTTAAKSYMVQHSETPLVWLHQNSGNIYNYMPWLKAESSALMVACPGNISVTTEDGECGVVVNYDLDLTSTNPPPQIEVVQNNVSPSETVNATIFCPNGQTRFRRFFVNSGPTDFVLDAIRVGVYQSLNNPSVTTNVYSQTGVLLYSNSVIVPVVNMDTYDISLGNTVIPQGENYSIEIVTPPPFVSIFKIGRNDVLPGATEAQITSETCTFAQMMVAGVSGANSVVMKVLGTPEEFIVVNNSNHPYESGDQFPIGVYQMDYEVFDWEGDELLDCEFQITVSEFNSNNTAIACNDQVNIALGEKCSAVVGAEHILKGDFYGCYDNYTVNITSVFGGSLGNTIDGSNLGQVLKVTVTAPDGNNCWGHILVEDKYGPQLECSDVYTTCVGDLTPGSAMSDRINIPGFSVNNILLPGAPNSKTFTIPVTGFSDINISNVGVHLNISHTRVSDLVATVKAPDGNMVTLFVSPGANAGPCTGDNVLVDIFDDAANSAADLLNMCNLVAPAISGEFRPTSSLSIFDNINADGNWEITIHDISNGEGGVINDVTLSFDQEGSTIPFPYPYEVNWIDLGNNSYWIENGDNCTSATLSYTDQNIQQGCQGEYLRIIRRCWTGVDEFNNNANGCCQDIYVYRNGLSAIIFPPDYDDLDEPALSCEDFGDDVPGLDDTGTVTGDFCDNIQIVPYTDVIIPICKRSYKIIRTHKVIEWCNSLVLEHNQIIKVMDKEGPELLCPDDITVSTNTYDCFATLTFEEPEILFDCSDEFSFNLEHAFGPFTPQFPCSEARYAATNVNQNTNTVTGFPIGTSFVKWTVEDECENYNSCCTKITVRDDVRPTAVCHDFTVVSIAANKEALINVESFDDGSHDNCGIKEIAVRKMTNQCLSGNTNFGPQALFCCDEIGDEIMVEMRVTDIYNNTNTCMVRASVQDKLPPYIKCPKNVTLDCQADYDDPELTFEPTAVDNCSVKEVFKEDDLFLTPCGTGYILRVWTAVDYQGLKHTCDQRITLYDDIPFNENDITWPENYETNKCGAALLPENLPYINAYPEISDDACSLVGVHYKDQVFKFVDGACEKILRTWTVLDWCTYDENYPELGQGWYEHVQIIKMHNDEAPVFETPCVERTYYSFGICEGEVSESVIVSDSCTPQDQIVVKYYIYINNKVNYQFQGTGKSYTRILPDGTHRVKWTAEDRCGNQSICEYLIHVEDGKKPTPYCLSSITTAVMNSNGRIEIWARDYDLGSTDNCTEQEDLWFTFFGARPAYGFEDEDHYFRGDGILATPSEYEAGVAQKWLHADRTSGIMFTCDDIPNGISENVSLDMSVTDIEGNSDYCTITLVLQDNADYCENQADNIVSVSGRVTLADTRPLVGTTIVMNSTQPEFPKTLESNQTGAFQFSGMKKNFDYNLSAQLNNKVDAGVSTLDLVLIQRHILAVQTFNNPYNCIAADIDGNEKINTVDLVNLRKVILGTFSEFPNGQKSWKIIPSNAQFPNMNAPWPLTEKYNYVNLSQNKSNQNFIGIKIGDVNNSIVLNVAGDPTEARSNNKLIFKTSEVVANEKEVIKIPVYVDGYNEVLGYQFTAEFDPTLFQVIGVESGVILINNDNIGLFTDNPGRVTMSWNAVLPQSISPDDAAFYWILEAKKNVRSTTIFDVNSDITKAEGIDADFRILKIGTGNKGNAFNETGAEFEVKQNTPNPFSAQTMIAFTIPSANDVVVKIHDVSGKELYKTKAYFEVGSHEIKIEKEVVGKSGIYYYQVSSGEFTATKKMVVIE